MKLKGKVKSKLLKMYCLYIDLEELIIDFLHNLIRTKLTTTPVVHQFLFCVQNEVYAELYLYISKAKTDQEMINYRYFGACSSADKACNQ